MFLTQRGVAPVAPNAPEISKHFFKAYVPYKNPPPYGPAIYKMFQNSWSNWSNWSNPIRLNFILKTSYNLMGLPSIKCFKILGAIGAIGATLFALILY
jgi:hypothetical protein